MKGGRRQIFCRLLAVGLARLQAAGAGFPLDTLHIFTGHRSRITGHCRIAAPYPLTHPSRSPMIRLACQPEPCRVQGCQQGGAYPVVSGRAMVKVYRALAAFGRLAGFLLRVLSSFRQNQGLLLSGAIALLHPAVRHPHADPHPDRACRISWIRNNSSGPCRPSWQSPSPAMRRS